MSEYPTQQPVVPAHVAQPQDHRSAETFTYQSPAGPITVPKFKKALGVGFLRKHRKLDEQDMMFTLLEEVCDKQSLATLDALTIEDIEPFFDQWRKDSGVGLGESSGS